MASDEVRFEERGGLGTVTLNRPAALNALTTAMAIAMNERLKAWARAPAIKAVLVRGAARTDGKVPFCTGGDIRALYDGRGDPEHRAGRAFFWHEYRLDRRIFHYPKPYLAFIDGPVMGGGVGISVHGSHRIFTEHALFAMPETGIGLFPDVGGSYFLPRLPGRIGFYLGLTGERLKAADALHLGVATQHVPAARLDALERALIEACRATDVDGAIERALAERRADPGAPPIAARMSAIARAFGGSSVEAIREALAAGSSEWERALGQMLDTKSPTSLKVTFRQLQKAAQLSFDECMRLEYRIALRVLEGRDFYEGIRAIIIDKDGKPRWSPARLEEVSKAAVNAYFAPLSGGELSFED